MTKILQTVIFLSIICTGPFFSCSSSKKDLGKHEIPKEEILKPAPKDNPFIPWKEAQLLMGEGNSWNGQYSTNGKEVRVTSSARTQHGQAEIYEIHLESSDVVRMTYQSGFAEEPHFFAAGPGLIYRSTTDELKERPALFESYEANPTPEVELPFLGKLGGYELYSRARKNADPVRLTRHKGFDGFASLSPDGKKLIYSSAEAGQLDLKVMDLSASPAKSAVLKAGPYHDSFPLFSPDGQSLFWIEIQTEPLTSRFYLGNTDATQFRLIAEFQGLAAFPDWHPHSRVIHFSGRRSAETRFEIFGLDLEKGCIQSVLKSDADLTYPSLSPDGKKILFTAEYEQKREVYQIPFETKPLKCP